MLQLKRLWYITSFSRSQNGFAADEGAKSFRLSTSPAVFPISAADRARAVPGRTFGAKWVYVSNSWARAWTPLLRAPPLSARPVIRLLSRRRRSPTSLAAWPAASAPPAAAGGWCGGAEGRGRSGPVLLLRAATSSPLFRSLLMSSSSLGKEVENGHNVALHEKFHRRILKNTGNISDTL